MKKTKMVLSMMLLSSGSLFAQTDTTDYYTLGLEELMNIQIVSASKKSESLFDAPLSASVLTRDEIRNSGVTSIVEALRLVPGVIVREQTNGNYDIHVRGLDNVPPNSLVLSSTNTTTLVMINNRPVYNYLQGGTFWESLPIDLNDIDKIEVVRGPSSTLYGPNAVSGVINIITATADTNGFSVNGGVQYGSLNSTIASTALKYRFNKKLGIVLSGNFQNRERQNSRYLDLITDRWVSSADQLAAPNSAERYPNPERSMHKYGVNTFINYSPVEDVNFSIAGGVQDAEVQNMVFDNSVANIGTSTTKSKYVDIHGSAYGLTGQFSYTDAVQAAVVGMPGSKYDYAVTDANLEYNFDFKNLSVKPGVTYRRAVYNDAAYWDVANGEGSLNGEEIMETLGGGVRIEYKVLNDKLRFTGGYRIDKFTHPDKWFSSYQAAAAYKHNDKNLVRLVFSKANRSPFIFDTYIDYTTYTPLGGGMFSTFQISGNRNLEMVNSNMFELGYRRKISSNVSLDLETYYTRTENYTALIQGATRMTPQDAPILVRTDLSIENIPMQVAQLGATMSFNMVISKLQLKPFVTLQKTTLEDYSPYFSTENAIPGQNNGFNPAANNVNSGIGSSRDHKFTPKVYGGFFADYKITSRLRFNVNSYFFGQHTFYHRDNTSFNDGVNGVENIKSKVILNAKVSYEAVKGIRVFVNGRNLLGGKSVEYYRGDDVPTMVFGGVNFDF